MLNIIIIIIIIIMHAGLQFRVTQLTSLRIHYDWLLALSNCNN